MNDPILYWNDVALEANRVSHSNGRKEQTGPTLSSRALGIVHLAMYDAFAGAAQANGAPDAPPHYLPGLPPASVHANVAAAVAAAAHATLSKLFPSQKPFFDGRHAAAGISGGGIAEGHAFGLLVAARMLADRANDPDAGDDGYAASVARGAHRPDPDNATQGFHAPFYGARSKGFAITERHGLERPPLPGSAEYLQALRQVRGKGIAPQLQGTLPNGIDGRTAEETLIGVYWGYDGANLLGTPPRLYNQIVRKVAEKQGNTPTQNARLFALVNAAMADAGILAWNQKYIHDLWRPVLGIREHDESMGPTGAAADGKLSDCDPFWLPLGAPASNSRDKNFTPPFPAYPSGHATFGAAAFHITRLFYSPKCKPGQADDLFDGMTFVSDELNGITSDNSGTIRPRHARSFKGGLWQMIEENGVSRVFLGVHWLFDAFVPDKKGRIDPSKKIGGVPLGIAIAEDIYNSGMMKSDVKPRP